MKWQATTGWEEIPAKHIADKGLVSIVYRELLQLSKTTNNPTKKWAPDLSTHFTKVIYEWLTSTWKDAQHH